MIHAQTLYHITCDTDDCHSSFYPTQADNFGDVRRQARAYGWGIIGAHRCPVCAGVRVVNTLTAGGDSDG